MNSGSQFIKSNSWRVNLIFQVMISYTANLHNVIYMVSHSTPLHIFWVRLLVCTPTIKSQITNQTHNQAQANQSQTKPKPALLTLITNVGQSVCLQPSPFKHQISHHKSQTTTLTSQVTIHKYHIPKLKPQISKPNSQSLNIHFQLITHTVAHMLDYTTSKFHNYKVRIWVLNYDLQNPKSKSQRAFFWNSKKWFQQFQLTKPKVTSQAV